jgi:hypothetical protein
VIEASCFALTHFLRKDMKASLIGSPAKSSGLISRFWEHKEVKLERLERFSSWERASLFANSSARSFPALFEWPIIH